ncbi:hypothetical protein OC835_007371, partial [Tilletia horrida]
MRDDALRQRVRNLLERLAAGEGNNEAAAPLEEESGETKKAKAAPSTEDTLPKQKERILAAARSAPVANTTEVQDFQAWITALILTQPSRAPTTLPRPASAEFGVTSKNAQHLSIGSLVELFSHRAALSEKRSLSGPALFRAILYDMEEGPGQGGVYMLTPDLAALYIDMTNKFARRASGHSNTRRSNVKYRAVQDEVLSSSLWRQRVLLDLDLPRLGLRFIETILNFASNASAPHNLNRRYIDIDSHRKKDDIDQDKYNSMGKALPPIVPYFVSIPVQRRQAQAVTSAHAGGPSDTATASVIRFGRRTWGTSA